MDGVEHLMASLIIATLLFVCPPMKALKAALDLAIGLGDPKYDSSGTDMLR